jgi:hypothetical protein
MKTDRGIGLPTFDTVKSTLRAVATPHVASTEIKPRTVAMAKGFTSFRAVIKISVS